MHFPCWQAHRSLKTGSRCLVQSSSVSKCRESVSRKNPVMDQQEFGRVDQGQAAFPLQEGKHRRNWLAPAKRRVADIGGVIPRPVESLPRAPVPAVLLLWTPGRLCPRLNAYGTADSRQNSCPAFAATISHSTRSRGPSTRVGWNPPAAPQRDFARGSRRSKHSLDSHIAGHGSEVCSVDGISIPQQISGYLVPGKRFPHLLHGPLLRGMFRHPEVQHPASFM